MHHRLLKISVFILFCAVFAVRVFDGLSVHANANRPPSRNTGALGESNCTSCHDGTALNTGGGTLTLTGLPAGYSPNQAIPLTVSVTQTGRAVFGFQVTAIDDTGKQAGTITATNTTRTILSTGTVSGNTRQYLGQTSAGTASTAANQGSWTFSWNAPAQPVGRVTFYVVGLAANNDGDTPGDLVYTISRTINPAAAAQCTYTINPTSSNIAAAGGAGTVAVTAGAGCNWTATSNAAFITITAGATGSGNGTVNYTVAANTGAARTGTLTIAGQTFTINQAAGTQCTYTISPLSNFFAAAGGTGTVAVTTDAGCNWTAASKVPWVTITAGATGSGNGTVGYTVAANTGAARIGELTIAGQTFSVIQAGQTQNYCDGDYEFRGMIQALPSTSGFIGDWTISGRTVRVSTFTEIEREDGQIAVGAYVEVEGCLQTDGSVIAKEIEVKSSLGGGARASFTGNVEELPNTMGRLGDWKVSGIVVHVSPATMIKQDKLMVAVGVKVEVEGARRADGSVDAYQVEVKSEMSGNSSIDFRGVVESLPSAAGRIGQWSVSGRKVNVTGGTRLKPENVAVAIGFSVQVKGTLRSDGSIDAAEIEVKSNGGGGGNFVEFYGTVEALPGTTGQIGMWTVSGRKITVAASTRIKWEEGPVVIGSAVEVKGALQADSSISAVKIKVKDHDGLFEFKGTVESLPAATNLVGDWRVSGRTIRVAASTQIERKYGMAVVGAFVGVYGVLLSDGSIDATEIEVKQGPAGGAYLNFNPVSTVSAASYLEESAPESIAAAFGVAMSSSVAAATQLPLPINLNEVSVTVDGKQARLFFVSPTQINYQIPQNTPVGAANVVVTSNGQTVAQGSIPVSSVSLSLFTANASGLGAPAGLLLRVKANGQQVYESLVRFDAAQNKFVPAPIVRRTGEQLFLVLFGSGLKQAANTDGNSANGVAENVQATIGGVAAQVVFAGSAPGFAGLEQINIRIPDKAAANPNTPVVVKARDLLNNWKQANPVTVSLQ